MRSMLFVPAIITQLILANASWADTYGECKLSCEAGREARDTECPSPYDFQNEGVDRAFCLSDSWDEYKRCLAVCTPPPSPPTPSTVHPPMN